MDILKRGLTVLMLLFLLIGSSARGAPTRALWALDIQAPPDIQKLLMTYLDLSKFRAAPPEEAITAAELNRLVNAAPTQIRELLQPLGYFDPQIEVKIVEPPTPSNTASATLVSEVKQVRIKVNPAEQLKVGRVTLEIQGTVQDKADSGDASAKALLEKLRRQWPLRDNEAFSQTLWSDAKNELLSTLKAEGYVSAVFSGTVAQVDVATRQVRLFVVADSGPLYRFGAVQIEGLSRYKPPVVEKLIPFHTGDIYSEKMLSNFQERLQKLGLFESVTVSMEPDEAQADAIPIHVKLRELLLRQTTAGVGLASNGNVKDALKPRLTVEHTDRQVFGQKWTSKTKLQLSEPLRSLQQDFLSYPQNGFYRNLISGLASIDNTQENVEVKNGKFRLGRSQDGERIERLYYGEWQRANTTTSGVENGSSAVSANYEWIWRDLDNILLPTQGLAASAKVSGGHAYDPRGPLSGEKGEFGRLTGRVMYYHPLGNSWFTQARLEAGAIMSRTDVAVPYTLLFRAGGDESVRGYDYQALGPSVGGVAVGGRVLATASAEIAHPFSASLPAWWWAVFIDAGDAASDWQYLNANRGYGAGVRWRSPVGPLRLDLAYGERDRKIRPYFSVGVTF
jgi:translocation and assembly module TamA